MVLYGWYDFLPIDCEVMKYLNIPKSNRRQAKRYNDFYKGFNGFRFIVYKLDRIDRRLNWIGDIK